MFPQICRRCFLSHYRSYRRLIFTKSIDHQLYFSSNFRIRQFSSSTSKRRDEPDLILPPSPALSIDQKSNRFVDEENRNVENLLNFIVEKLNERGTKLILTDSFMENLNRSPLSLLLNERPNVRFDYLVEAFTLRPKFLEIPLSRWETILKIFREAEIPLGIVLAALVGHPKIFEMDPKELNQALIDLNSLGIRDRALASVLAKRPQILSSDLNEIHVLIENMNSFFSREKLLRIVRRDPEILLMNFDKLESKYEYIYYEMGLESQDVFNSKKWYRLPLSTIECRHQFLIRCGVYIKPDQKKKEIAVDNPRLRDILNTDDREFVRSAGVSILEWEIFQKIFDEEEPYQASGITYRFLKRSGRTTPKEKENLDEGEWEDVSMDEFEDDVDQAGSKKGKNIKEKKGGKREKENRLTNRRDFDQIEDNQKRTAINQKFFTRQLSSGELAELRNRIEKMRVVEGDGYTNLDRDDESESDDEDELDREEETKMIEREKSQIPKLGYKARGQFRKRGTFLASKD